MYMVQQRTTTAVREGYRGADPKEVERQLEAARQARAWLEGLTIEPDIRASLVEPICAIEEALAEISRAARRGEAPSHPGGQADSPADPDGTG